MRRYYITRSDLKKDPNGYKVTGSPTKSIRNRNELWRYSGQAIKSVL